jgi:hypothetical protein
MVAVRRALLIQIGGLVLAAIFLITLSRFLPVADLLAQVQSRVMGWGSGAQSFTRCSTRAAMYCFCRADSLVSAADSFSGSGGDF